MEGENLFNIQELFILPLNSSSIIEIGNEGSLWNRSFTGRGILDVFGFNFDINTNNLPLKGAWLPFMHYLISSSNKIGNNNIFLGRAEPTIFKNQRNQLKIVGMDGYFEQLNSTSNISFENISFPGFYSILSNKDTLNTFSANVDTNEIISDKIDFKLLQQKFSQNCFIFNKSSDITNPKSPPPAPEGL